MQSHDIKHHWTTINQKAVLPKSQRQCNGKAFLYRPIDPLEFRWQGDQAVDLVIFC